MTTPEDEKLAEEYGKKMGPTMFGPFITVDSFSACLQVAYLAGLSEGRRQEREARIPKVLVHHSQIEGIAAILQEDPKPWGKK